MYEKLFQSKKKPSGKWLYVLLSASLVICIVTIVLVADMLRRDYRFKQYISDFSGSTSHAYSQGYMLVTVNGIERHITGDSIHSVYNLIVNCRGIQEQERPETEPEVIVDFGDNTLMEFWTSKLENASNGREFGLLIGYRNPEGEYYYYDTDRLDIDRVKLLVRRKVDLLGKNVT